MAELQKKKKNPLSTSPAPVRHKGHLLNLSQIPNEAAFSQRYQTGTLLLKMGQITTCHSNDNWVSWPLPLSSSGEWPGMKLQVQKERKQDSQWLMNCLSFSNTRRLEAHGRGCFSAWGFWCLRGKDDPKVLRGTSVGSEHGGSNSGSALCKLCGLAQFT